MTTSARRRPQPPHRSPRDSAEADMVVVIIAALVITGTTAVVVVMSGLSGGPEPPAVGEKLAPGECGGAVLTLLTVSTSVPWQDLRVEVKGLTTYTVTAFGRTATSTTWEGAAVGGGPTVSAGDSVHILFPPQDTATEPHVQLVHAPTGVTLFSKPLLSAARDSTAPAVEFTAPPRNVTAGDRIPLMARDAGCSGVSLVEAALYSEDDGLYWSGTAFAATSRVWLRLVEDNGHWVFPLEGIPLVDGAKYWLEARAGDAAGNVQPLGSVTSFTYRSPR